MKPIKEMEETLFVKIEKIERSIEDTLKKIDKVQACVEDLVKILKFRVCGCCSYDCKTYSCIRRSLE